MEKIMKRYVMDEVFEVIDKHIGYHEQMMLELKAKMLNAIINGVNGEMVEIEENVHSSASAIAALSMLKKELKGEAKY